jgi:hypothetical protein
VYYILIDIYFFKNILYKHTQSTEKWQLNQQNNVSLKKIMIYS